ncbi:response regulator [Fulvivirgaceae bacterium PWU4]|uniref:histidine kinase n=1 Tax=Chryseosolibacter histidini TaxID=2782349 RepID=A0AAP2GND4_9BACT|nr:ATP-binding protein [Chryseosolibacter histidini]MBT1696397.1 response regulator [Chryseosolibacter histidini]
MKQLLEQSKKQLLTPLGNARRKLLIILNIVYCILAPSFLISEKIATGNFVNDSIMWLVYGTAILFNALSAVYNILIFSEAKIDLKNSSSRIIRFLYDRQKNLDVFFGYASIIPVLFMSFCNMMGLGNPFNDSIITDFALAQSLMIVVVIITGRLPVLVWFLIVVAALFWNVSKRGWDYEYHYSTPTEVATYKKALDNKEAWALKRQAELADNNLNPPKVTRYFNIWMVFIIVSFLVAYFYSGITNDIFKIVPAVVHNIEQVSEESTRMELAQKTNEEKANTFINLAHETKTPLTLINNYLDEYIKKHGKTEEIEIIKWNVQRLTTDIINFFDLERFNRGINIYDHSQASDFGLIVSRKLPLFKSLAHTKEVEIREKIQGSCFVLAHPSAIERIVNNLLENSIKYTERGTINVALFAQADQICFSVTDTGIGIPPSLHSRVFEPYIQLEKSLKFNQGMGMGLSIVKKIVNDLKGTIKLESEPGHGTTISVYLQRHVLTDGEQPVQHDVTIDEVSPIILTETLDKVSDSSRPVIMVVEDNQEMLSYLVKNLEEKYNVYVAASGAEALEKLKFIAHIDLIVSDVMMNGMDGMEFCRVLSMSEFYRHIPFIFLTAKTTATDKLTALRLGAIDYIEKPFIVDHLMLKIESLLSNIRKQKAAVIQAYHLFLQDPATPVSGPGSREFEMNCKKYDLTQREIEIISLLMKGQPYKVIGSSLAISSKTVARHVATIFAKLDVNNKIELINKLMPGKSPAVSDEV